MRRQRFRAGQFLITTFTCGAGEERYIPPSELNRGLTKAPIGDLLEHHPNAKPLNPVTIFTKGSFEMTLGWERPFQIKAGHGGYRTAYVDSWENVRLKSLEEDSQYHCILPLDRVARYWDRRPFNLEPGQSADLEPGQFFYLATGSVEVAEQAFTGPAMIEAAQPRTVTALEPVIGVKLWI